MTITQRDRQGSPVASPPRSATQNSPTQSPSPRTPSPPARVDSAMLSPPGAPRRHAVVLNRLNLERPLRAPNIALSQSMRAADGQRRTLSVRTSSDPSRARGAERNEQGISVPPAPRHGQSDRSLLPQFGRHLQYPRRDPYSYRDVGGGYRILVPMTNHTASAVVETQRAQTGPDARGYASDEASSNRRMQPLVWPDWDYAAWDFDARDYAATSPYASHLTPGHQLTDDVGICTFLNQYNREPIAIWIRRLSQFSQACESAAVTQELTGRLGTVIRRYESDAQAREGLNHVAMVSVTDCHDGDLNGLLAMEKYIGELCLIDKVRAGELNIATLQSSARQHYGLHLLEETARDLCEALGSTAEAVEVALLLVRHLGQDLDLPVHNQAMGQTEYAVEQFMLAFGAWHHKYQERLGAVDASDQYSALARPDALADRLDFVGAWIGLQRQDKEGLMRFMANWQPSRAYVERKFGPDFANSSPLLSEPFELVESVHELCAKPMLDEADQEQLRRVLTYLHRHRAVLPEALCLVLDEALTKQEGKRLSYMTDALAEASLQAVGLIRDDLTRSYYQRALERLVNAGCGVTDAMNIMDPTVR